MSEFTSGRLGLDLVHDERWDAAIEHLTKAIKVTQSPIWLLARAKAYQRKKELERSLVDCEHAYLATLSRQSPSRMEQLKDAQYYRAVALFKMGRYADADACCVWAMRLGLGMPVREEDPVAGKVNAEGDYTATVAEAQADKPMLENAQGDMASSTQRSSWVKPYSFRALVLSAMEKLPKGVPGRKITVTRVPNPPPLVDGEFKPEGTVAEAAPAEADVKKTAESGQKTALAVETPKEQKLRFDYFQSPATVTLNVFIKGVDKAKFNVEAIGDQTILLRNLPRASNPNAVLSLNNPIVPSATKFTVGTVKIEISLKKANSGQKWGAWGSELTVDDAANMAFAATHTAEEEELLTTAPAAQKLTLSGGGGAPSKSATTPTTTNATSSSSSSVPLYPTSSKKGPKDWEKLSREGEEQEEEGGDIDQFFKRLFKDADPETRRAMMKSYVESNGTELSTDWNDVKNRKVEPHPPDGVEKKDW